MIENKRDFSKRSNNFIVTQALYKMTNTTFKAEFLMYMEQEIIFADFTQCHNQEEIISFAHKLRKVLLDHPDIGLAFADVRGISIGKEVMELAKKIFLQDLNKRKLKMAVIGIEGITKMLHSTLLALSTNKLKGFSSKAEALDWIVR